MLFECGGSNNPWTSKAKALDRYRWALLRERHGFLGSALRFAREILVDWWFGFRAKRRLAISMTVEPCDFLLLQSTPKVIKFQRKKLLIEGLRGRGYNLVETALQEPKAILRERLLRMPPFVVPTRYFGLAAYAQWLVDHHQPRILLNDRNGSLYAPFLRLALNARNSLLVHLAHATTVEGSRRLGMNDYDYYFLFGQSSLEALQARELRFGSSIAVLTGSHMIDDTFNLPLASPEQKTILVLGVGPDKEKEKCYQEAYSLISMWAAGHPEWCVLIKRHPRSDANLWAKVVMSSNVKLLPADVHLGYALKSASLVVNFMSNAVIEAALARRPVIYVGAGRSKDIFQQECFFGAVVESVEALDAKIMDIEEDYFSATRAAENFATYHLAGGFKGLDRTLSLLEGLVSGGSLDGELEVFQLHSTI